MMDLMTAEQQEAEAWRALGPAQRKLAWSRVYRGERLLDQKLGKVWPFHMRLDTFDLSTGCSCVLGQLAVDIVPKRQWMRGGYYRFRPSYNHALNTLRMSGRKAQTHGFQADHDAGLSYEALAYAWRSRIRSRGGR